MEIASTGKFDHQKSLCRIKLHLFVDTSRLKTVDLEKGEVDVEGLIDQSALFTPRDSPPQAAKPRDPTLQGKRPARAR